MEDGGVLVEVAHGDGKGTEEVACADGCELSGEFEADDGIEDGLDGGARGEVDLFEWNGDDGAGLEGAAGGFADVAALLFGVGGVVVDAEAGGFAGGEAAGLAVAGGGGAGSGEAYQDTRCSN